MFQHMIDDTKNKLPFEKYLDKEDIALIKLLIKGNPSDEYEAEVVEKVCYHFYYN